MTDDPAFIPLPMQCLKCSHEWSPVALSPGDIPVAIVVVRALVKLGCPACGKHRIHARLTVMANTDFEVPKVDKKKKKKNRKDAGL